MKPSLTSSRPIASTNSTKWRSGSTIFSGATIAIGSSKRRRQKFSAMTKRANALRSPSWITSCPRVVRLLHPFMPHITEELWSLLGFGKSSIQFAAPPKVFELARPDIAEKRALASAIYNTVQAGRNLRAESKIPSNKKVRFVLRAPNEMLRAELPTMARLLNAEDIALDSSYAAEPGVPVAATSLGELFLLISETDQGSGTRATRKGDRKNREANCRR